MKKTFKNQLPVFIPECILFVTVITFGVLLMINFPYMYSHLSGKEVFQVHGSILDLILFTVSACVIGAASIAMICMGHLFKSRDLVKWIDKATFVSGVVMLAYDITLVSLMLGLLLREGILHF